MDYDYEDELEDYGYDSNTETRSSTFDPVYSGLYDGTLTPNQLHNLQADDFGEPYFYDEEE